MAHNVCDVGLYINLIWTILCRNTVIFKGCTHFLVQLLTFFLHVPWASALWRNISIKGSCLQLKLQISIFPITAFTVNTDLHAPLHELATHPGGTCLHP